jgi:hypothetical protein
MNQPPTEETYAAITNREAFAKTRGVTRNAIDQLMAGNTHDCYRPFRDFFQSVCFTKECDPMPYLNDLQGIYRAARLQGRKIAQGRGCGGCVHGATDEDARLDRGDNESDERRSFRQKGVPPDHISIK